MNDAVLQIRWAGPHVSIQDGGRPGLMRFGVPRSGPMDRLSFAAANVAVGNDAAAPAIEVSLGGLMLDCVAGRVGFAVAGGGFVVDHGGQRRGSWFAASLRAGERLAIRPGRWGSWCCLALGGHLDVPLWLDSASTHALSGLGGGPLVAGRTIRVGDVRPAPDHARPIACPVGARPRSEVRVTIGPQQRFFAPDTLAAFLAGPWHTTDAGDRMGVRLAGPRVAPDATLDMPSEPVARGSVQVAGDGAATVLLADHQTTGGYPKIATVLDCDLDAFVQLRPRDAVAFRPVGAEQAVGIARTAARTAAAWLSGLSRD